MRRKDFLLTGEIQIQCEQKLVPRFGAPAKLSITRSQGRRGNQSHPRSVCYKIKIATAIIISRGALQCMTDPGRKREKTDSRRRACSKVTKRQMNVNAYENKVVGDAVNNAAIPVFPVSQTRELTIRIVKRIGANMKRHADDVRA